MRGNIPSWKQCLVTSKRNTRPNFPASRPDCLARLSTCKPPGSFKRRSEILASVTMRIQTDSSNYICQNHLRRGEVISKEYKLRKLSETTPPRVRTGHITAHKRRLTLVMTCPGLATLKLNWAQAASMISTALRSSGVTLSGVSNGPVSTESKDGTVWPTASYCEMTTLTESWMRFTSAERRASEIVDI